VQLIVAAPLARGLRPRLPAYLPAAAAPRLTAELICDGVYGGHRAGLPEEDLKGRVGNR